MLTSFIARQKISNSRGGVLIGVVVTMVVMAALGAGMVSMVGTSHLHGVRANFGERAYYLAESGFRYAVSQYVVNDEAALLDLHETTVNVPGGGRFYLEVEKTDDPAVYAGTLTVDGSYDSGTEIEKGQDLKIVLPGGLTLPKRNGMIELGGKEVRYFRFDEETSTLIRVSYDDSETKLVVNPGMTATHDPIVIIKSTGSYPSAGLQGVLGVDRTVTYAWPMSGGSGSPLEEIEGSEYAVAPMQPGHWSLVPGTRLATDTYADPVLGRIRTTELMAIDYWERGSGNATVRYMWIPFNYTSAGVDLGGARSSNSGYLSYEIQAKISISRPLEYASAGIGFRAAQTRDTGRLDYSGYVVSFMRYRWPVAGSWNRDYISGAVKPARPGDADKLLLVLWEQTGSTSVSGDDAQRQWLAYAVIEGMDPLIESTGWSSDGFIIQHLSSMIIRVVEKSTVSGRTNKIQVFFGDPNPGGQNPYFGARVRNNNPYDIRYNRAGYMPAHVGNNYVFDVRWPSLPGLSDWTVDNDYFSAVGGDPLLPAVEWKAVNVASNAILLADDQGNLTIIQDNTHTTENANFDDSGSRPEIAMHAFGDLRDSGPRRRAYFSDFAIRLLKGDGTVAGRDFINPIQY